MKESKNYIPAYGANNDLHWFPMKVALSIVLSVGKVLDEANIKFFIPTNEDVIPNIDGHKIVLLMLMALEYLLVRIPSIKRSIA